jgi:hypothetical protein
MWKYFNNNFTPRLKPLNFNILMGIEQVAWPRKAICALLSNMANEGQQLSGNKDTGHSFNSDIR